MKTLYESLLDIANNEKYIDSMSAKIIKDEFMITNLSIDNAAWTNVNPARYFEWKKLQKDVAAKHWDSHSNQWYAHYGDTKIDVHTLVDIYYHQPILNTYESFVAYIRNFLKKGFAIRYHDNKMTNNKVVVGFEIYPEKQSGNKEDYLDVIYTLKKDNIFK